MHTVSASKKNASHNDSKDPSIPEIAKNYKSKRRSSVCT
jgi:hypothetical protein